MTKKTSFTIQPMVIKLAESHSSDEAEALLEAINHADEEGEAQDQDVIIELMIAFLDLLVLKKEITEAERIKFLDLDENELDEDGLVVDDADMLEDLQSGDA